MRTAKMWVKGIGVVALLVGGLSLPVGLGINPERDTSVFHNLSDLGVFIEYGLALILAGIVLVVISVLIPARSE